MFLVNFLNYIKLGQRVVGTAMVVQKNKKAAATSNPLWTEICNDFICIYILG